MNYRPRTCCNHKCSQSDLCPARTGKPFRDSTGCSPKAPITQGPQAQAATKNVADDEGEAMEITDALLVSGACTVSFVCACIGMAWLAGLL